MEGVEAQQARRPRSGLGAWVGLAAARSLPWFEAGAERAELRTKRAVGSFPASSQKAAVDGDARMLTSGATDSSQGPSGAAGLIHDARNMVTAIELYCDLLDEPGVLTEACRHYAAELRTVSAASRRLLERIDTMEGGA
ncbi:MAG TPA: hypothetical protein VIM62_10840, partial [Acidobacteriaceae bacterium]